MTYCHLCMVGSSCLELAMLLLLREASRKFCSWLTKIPAVHQERYTQRGFDGFRIGHAHSLPGFLGRVVWAGLLPRAPTLQCNGCSPAPAGRLLPLRPQVLFRLAALADSSGERLHARHWHCQRVLAVTKDHIRHGRCGVAMQLAANTAATATLHTPSASLTIYVTLLICMCSFHFFAAFDIL